MFEIMLGISSKKVDVVNMEWITESNTLPDVLYRSQAIKTETRVYLLGGYDNSYSDKIYSAPLLEDGVIGSWITESNTLPIAFRSSHVVKTESRVYLLGGHNGNVLNKIFSAPLGTDGIIGDWVTESNIIPNTLYDSQVVKTETRVYLLGGVYHRSGYATNQIYSAPLLSDGTIGNWITESNTLPIALYESQAIKTETRVYLLGGYISSRGVTNQIYSASLLSDGTIGNWIAESNTLPIALRSSQAIKTNSRVYLLSGHGSSGMSNKIYSAPLLEGGTIGNWIAEKNVTPTKIFFSQVIRTDSRIYLLGGNDTAGVTDKIYSAPLLE